MLSLIVTVAAFLTCSDALLLQRTSNVATFGHGKHVATRERSKSYKSFEFAPSQGKQLASEEAERPRKGKKTKKEAAQAASQAAAAKAGEAAAQACNSIPGCANAAKGVATGVDIAVASAGVTPPLKSMAPTPPPASFSKAGKTAKAKSLPMEGNQTQVQDGVIESPDQVELDDSQLASGTAPRTPPPTPQEVAAQIAKAGIEACDQNPACKAPKDVIIAGSGVNHPVVKSMRPDSSSEGKAKGKKRKN